MKSFISCLFMCGALVATFSSEGKRIELNRIVAVANKGVILQSDVEFKLKEVKLDAHMNHQSLPSDEVLRTQVLDKLIMDAILLQDAAKFGIKVNDEQLAKGMQQMAASRGIPLAGLKKRAKKLGITYSALREQIRKEMVISQLRNAYIQQRIKVLPDEVNSLARQLALRSNVGVKYKLQHIQLPFDEGASKQEVRQKMAQILTQLKKKTPFSKLAYTYSKGPKALSGGSWGWMLKEEMPTIFADQLDMQPKGSLIGPFESGLGLHLLRIEDTKGLKTVSATEVRARHILIKPTIILDDVVIKNKLRDYIKQIRTKKATFAELAKEHSEDFGSAVEGGDLGYQSPDMYVPAFKKMCNSLAVGEISQPFKSVHGWHIVQVLDRRRVDKTETAMKERAHKLIFNRKFNEEMDAWIEEKRAEAYINILSVNKTPTAG